MAEKKEEKKNDKKEAKSSKGIMIILFILGLLVLGAATFGGVYLFMQTRDRIQSQQVVTENAYVDLGELTVNLSDEGGKRYFKGQLSVGYDKRNKKVAEELESNLVVVKDVVIFYFKSQKADFINNTANEEEIKKQLIENINKELVRGKINDIRFNSIIVQ